VNERWTVLGDDETVEVPAGTFEHVIHFQKVGSGSTKNYWYAPDVGKVKETGSQTEELVDYHLEAP
jgi:DNA/RNA endonuclease G (NUC1)